MDQLPCYSSLISPPTYEASVSQLDESIWPRNYGRETPRINVAKFYHNLVLNSPLQDEDEDEDEEDEEDEFVTRGYYCCSPSEKGELKGTLPPSPPPSPSSASSSTSTSTSLSSLQPSSSSSTALSVASSSSSLPTSSLSSLLDHHHHHTITELNRLLLQTWSNAETLVPSYEAFKAKVNSHDLRPIPNTFR